MTELSNAAITREIPGVVKDLAPRHGGKWLWGWILPEAFRLSMLRAEVRAKVRERAAQRWARLRR